MVRYPIRAARALGFLRSYYNDIEIYVEDTTCRQMYAIALQRIIGERATVKSVIPLGGKIQVIDACARDQVADGRARLYIIDGDFDMLMGIPTPRLKFLYRLKSYCFENIIIDRKASINVARQSLSNLDTDLIENMLDYEVWMNRILEQGFKLYLVYAIAKSLNVPIKTVNFSVMKFCEQSAEGPDISPQKVRQRLRILIGRIITHSGVVAYRDKKAEIISRSREIKPHFVVSGKSYLLPLLYHRITKIARHRGNMDSLRVNLSNFFEIDNEPGLRTRVRRAIRGR